MILVHKNAHQVSVPLQMVAGGVGGQGVLPSKAEA